MSQPAIKRPPRGAIEKSGCTFLAAWVPNDIIAEIDATVRAEDTDRSKFIRKALRHYLARKP